MTMMRWTMIGAAALALAGCAPREGAPGSAGMPRGSAAVETITYETGPCFGFCPVYRVEVRADGTGTFTGIRNTDVTGERAFTLTAAQYARFRDTLAPYRPSMGDRVFERGGAGCEQVATDLPSVDIHWAGPKQPRQRLYFYYGCDMEANRALADALGNAPDALPIEDFVGAQP